MKNLNEKFTKIRYIRSKLPPTIINMQFNIFRIRMTSIYWVLHGDLKKSL